VKHHGGPPPRSFLFLQGVCSPFFARLGDALRARGHAVHRMHFNAGDVLQWGLRRGWRYRAPLAQLQAHARDLLARHGIGDVVLFGDQRPVHRAVLGAAVQAGARAHVFEEGYFRPAWVTLERGGVNGNSLLPRDPQWYRETGARLPDYGNGAPVPAPLLVRAWHDACYHLAGAFNPVCFPHYRTHALHTAPVEYAAYLWRAQRTQRRLGADARRVRELVAAKTPYFLLPLQLDTDAQVRYHSRYAHMGELLGEVVASFARHAPTDAQLVVKIHPLDCGLRDHEGELYRLGREFGVAERLCFLESGHLPTLLGHARGVATINSTVGGSALVHRCPLIALGRAIYDMPGLTHQGTLDSFWREREKPDAELFRCFRNTVIHTTQINGGFYTRAGIDMTVRAAVPRIEATPSLLEQWL